MGWMHGFMSAAGELAQKQNLLDQAAAKQKYDETISAIEDLANSPNTPWEEKSRIYNRLASLKAKGPYKIKDNDLNISDLYLTSLKRSPKPAVIDVQRTTAATDQFPVGTPKFTPSGIPAFYEKEPPSYLQYSAEETPGYQGPTQFSPYEQAMMKGEEGAIQAELSAPGKRAARYIAPKKMGVTTKYTGSQLRAQGIHTIKGPLGNQVPVEDESTYNVTPYEGQDPEIQGPIDMPAINAGEGFDYTTNKPVKLVRKGNRVIVLETPDSVQINAPTDEHKITLPEGGFGVYKTYKANNLPVVSPDGFIDIAYTDPPSSWLSSTTEGQVFKNTGGLLEPFQTLSTTAKTPPESPFTFSTKLGQMTLNGYPIRYLGKGGTPLKPNTDNVVPLNQNLPGSNIINVPTPGNDVPNTGITPPPKLPESRDSKAALGISPKLKYNRITDVDWFNRPKINYNDFNLSSMALASYTPGVNNANPYLQPNTKTNPLLSEKYIPEAVIPVPIEGDKNNDGALVDAEPGQLREVMTAQGGGVHKISEGAVATSLKPLNTNQMGTYQNHINALGTTSDFLSQLLQPDIIKVLIDKNGNTRFWNAFQVGLAESGRAGAIITNVVSSFKKRFGIGDPKELKALEKLIAVRKNMTEHIQTIRTPLGAAGFRSLEAFGALQKQFGDPFLPPEVMFMTMRNTLKTVLTIQASYQQYLNLSKQATRHPLTRKPMAGPNYPTEETQKQYLAAYGNGKAAKQAMLRDGWDEPK